MPSQVLCPGPKASSCYLSIYLPPAFLVCLQRKRNLKKGQDHPRSFIIACHRLAHVAMQPFEKPRHKSITNPSISQIIDMIDMIDTGVMRVSVLSTHDLTCHSYGHSYTHAIQHRCTPCWRCIGASLNKCPSRRRLGSTAKCRALRKL